MPKQIAEWNTELKLWTSSKGNQLLELWEPFLATWPKSGMTQNGQAFELPTLEQLTNASESLSSPILRTPAASEAERGHQTESVARARGGQVTLSGQMKELFPTPIVSDWKNGKSSPGYGMNLPETAKSLLPTPKALDGIKGNTQTSESRKAKGFYVDLPNVAIDLIPTTRVSMANGPTRSEIAKENPKSRIEVEVMLGETNWGKYEPAISRWELVIGRPAPAPTKPDGKDGGHRLSSLFTEWLMGLPEGWITGLGLKRNDELKLAGNGVVPQQAELALRILLEDDNLLERIKK